MVDHLNARLVHYGFDVVVIGKLSRLHSNVILPTKWSLQLAAAVLLLLISILPISVINTGPASSRKLQYKGWSYTHVDNNSINFTPDFPLQVYLDITLCRTIAGLSKAQRNICYQQPDAVAVAIQGLQSAIQECRHQFQHHRWNCSSFNPKSNNPYSSPLLRKGYRESAFVYALASAGVTVSVAKGCSQGLIANCGCESNSKYRPPLPLPTGTGTRSIPARLKREQIWKWSGCSHNINYAMKFSKRFLDVREQSNNIHSAVNLHNNHIGRLAVSENMETKCKCHGLSGSCELKTCWTTTPDLRAIGRTLKDRFRNALMVQQSNWGNHNADKITIIPSEQDRWKQKRNIRNFRKTKRKRSHVLTSSLLYYQKSPNYCERDTRLGIPGTTGRMCNQTDDQRIDNCRTLCCGRGYNVIRRRKVENCNCKFKWCCQVECDVCKSEQWLSACK